MTLSLPLTYSHGVLRLYSHLVRYGVPTALAIVALVWIGAHFTWLSLPLYPVITVSVAAAAVATGANLLHLWQNGSRKRMTKLWISFGLMATAGLVAITVNVSVLVLTTVAVAALVAIARYRPQPGYPRTLAFSVIAALPVFAGAAAVDPVLAWQLPQVIIAAAIAMLFTLVLGLTDIAHSRQQSELPRSANLMAALALCFVLVLTMIAPVTIGWYGNLFRNLAIYTFGLPALGLFIIVWGNPTDTMLRIGRITLRVGSVLVLAALALA